MFRPEFVIKCEVPLGSDIVLLDDKEQKQKFINDINQARKQLVNILGYSKIKSGFNKLVSSKKVRKLFIISLNLTFQKGIQRF